MLSNISEIDMLAYLFNLSNTNTNVYVLVLKVQTRVTLKSLRCSFGPIPDSIRRWGDPMAPLERMTSLRARIVTMYPL